MNNDKGEDSNPLKETNDDENMERMDRISKSSIESGDIRLLNQQMKFFKTNDSRTSLTMDEISPIATSSPSENGDVEPASVNNQKVGKTFLSPQVTRTKKAKKKFSNSQPTKVRRIEKPPTRRSVFIELKMLQIGRWRVESVSDGDLVLWFIFNQKLFLLDILDGGLFFRIEIPWNTITGMVKWSLPRNDSIAMFGMDIDQKPSFFSEDDPKPQNMKQNNANWKKSSSNYWKSCSDFTELQATALERIFFFCESKHLQTYMNRAKESFPVLGNFLEKGLKSKVRSQNDEVLSQARDEAEALAQEREKIMEDLRDSTLNQPKNVNYFSQQKQEQHLYPNPNQAPYGLSQNFNELDSKFSNSSKSSFYDSMNDNSFESLNKVNFIHSSQSVPNLNDNIFMKTEPDNQQIHQIYNKSKMRMDKIPRNVEREGFLFQRPDMMNMNGEMQRLYAHQIPSSEQNLMNSSSGLMMLGDDRKRMMSSGANDHSDSQNSRIRNNNRNSILTSDHVQHMMNQQGGQGMMLSSNDMKRMGLK